MPQTKGEMFTEIARVISLASGLMQNRGEKTAAGVGLTSARWSVLGALRRAQQPQTVPEIARALGQARQGVQRIVNAMVSDGLVAYQDNPGHASSKKVALTEAGLKVHESLRARQEKWSALIAQDMAVEDLKTLSRLLTELAEKLGR